MVNKIVARFVDGGLVKGSTNDFNPGKDSFHVLPVGPGQKPVMVFMRDLKAVFFVRDLVGNPHHRELKAFDATKKFVGRKASVAFKDGEVLVGTTENYQPGRPGFFLIPVDPTANNQRCYIPMTAVRKVDILP
jgi:hypothetical protein